MRSAPPPGGRRRRRGPRSRRRRARAAPTAPARSRRTRAPETAIATGRMPLWCRRSARWPKSGCVIDEAAVRATRNAPAAVYDSPNRVDEVRQQGRHRALHEVDGAVAERQRRDADREGAHRLSHEDPPHMAQPRGEVRQVLGLDDRAGAREGVDDRPALARDRDVAAVEQQVARGGRIARVDRGAGVLLGVGVPRQQAQEAAVQRLHEAGAVEAARGDAAPQVGDAEEAARLRDDGVARGEPQRGADRLRVRLAEQARLAVRQRHAEAVDLLRDDGEHRAERRLAAAAERRRERGHDDAAGVGVDAVDRRRAERALRGEPGRAVGQAHRQVGVDRRPRDLRRLAVDELRLPRRRGRRLRVDAGDGDAAGAGRGHARNGRSARSTERRRDRRVSRCGRRRCSRSSRRGSRS